MTRTQLIIFVALCVVSTGINAEDPKRLVFADSFSRNESQEEKDEVGNGWRTNADKPWARAPKQVDLRDGALYVTPADAKGSGVLASDVSSADVKQSLARFLPVENALQKTKRKSKDKGELRVR